MGCHPFGFLKARCQENHLQRFAGGDILARPEGMVAIAIDHAVHIEIIDIGIEPVIGGDVGKHGTEIHRVLRL